MSNLAAERKQAECSKKMGELLLKGYAMLEEVCPDCMVPIMRSRQGEEQCVICNDAYKQKDDADVVNPEAVTTEVKKTVQPIAKKDDFLPNEDEYAQMLKEYEQSRGAPVSSASSYLASKQTRPGGGLKRQPLAEPEEVKQESTPAPVIQSTPAPSTVNSNLRQNSISAIESKIAELNTAIARPCNDLGFLNRQLDTLHKLYDTLQRLQKM